MLPPLSQMVSHQEVHFPRPPATSRGVWITSTGFENCREDYVVDRKGFAGFGIELVVAGQGTVTLDDVDAELLPGSLFVYGPRTRHRICCRPGRPMAKYFFDLDGPEAREFLLPAGLRPGRVLRSADPEGMRSVAGMILETLKMGRDGGCEPALAGLRFLLLLADARRVAGGRQSAAGERMAEVRLFIEDNLFSLRGLSDIAAGVGIEPAYLCRVFRRHWGTSPGRFLSAQKLQAAAIRLVSSGRSIKDIAAEVGFEDPLHFSRAFRSHFGISPAAFRERPRFRDEGTGQT